MALSVKDLLPFSIASLVMFSVACLSSPVPPDAHYGMFIANKSYGHSLHIEQVNGVDYVTTAWGKAAIDVDLQGGFNAKDHNVTLYGKFDRLNNGQYQFGELTYFNVHYTFSRTETPQGSELVAKLFDIPSLFVPISGANECKKWQKVNDVPFDQSKVRELSELSANPNNSYSDTTSLLIAKNGKLVVEEYFNGWDPEFPHTIQSITKSLTSLAMGDAINRGLIKSEAQKLSELMPAYAELLSGDKAQLTLAHLLTMGAGLDWNEWSTSYENPNNPRQKEMASLDPIAFVLDRGLISKPGEQFRYNGGLVTIIGELLSQRAEVDNFADYWRTSPLNALCFENAYFTNQTGGVTNAAGGGMLRPIDLLKVGQLVAQDGVWQEKRLLPKGWIERSTQRHLATGDGIYDYGYYWWLDDIDVAGKTYPVTFGLGYGGQVVAIVNELDLVVARTATHFMGRTPNIEMMRDYIIPAFTL
ncbi:beta-lactamase [Vibrio sinaloensis DSM 21326]|uniref:Beta-lactamase n=1 Tax=Vibrio sinaloensis DSM 21326 TaxID=945550 RepID=E8M9B6_PHOS4|nr:serine hydrolase [Vibrio sinaloensis]EGA69472.1 beta-lactamase [Vibrio sinaloensis DSM 21326]